MLTTLKYFEVPTFDLWFFIYFVFAAGLLISSTMVVKSNTPLGAILFFLLSIVNQSGLLLLLNLEFFALILLLVYAGAIMMLYLFVVMMLQLPVGRFQWQRLSSIKYLALLFFTELVCVYQRSFGFFEDRYYSFSSLSTVDHPAEQLFFKALDSRSLGYFLYTHFGVIVLLQAFILLVVLVGSIFLVSHDDSYEKGA